MNVVDPWATETPPALYPPVDPKAFRVLVAPRRPPYCRCPRMVQADGWLRVWHEGGCTAGRTEVLSEALEAIL